jgi:positive regulator of sigma E activity
MIFGGLEFVAGGYLIHRHYKHKNQKKKQEHEVEVEATIHFLAQSHRATIASKLISNASNL